MATSQQAAPREASDGYRAARETVALLDRSAVGRLRINGRDALDLLDRLSTNHLRDLTPGHGLHTVLTTNKGRVVDLLFVLAGEAHLLVLTGRLTRRKVPDWIDFYTFTEDVSVEDVTDETAMLSLVGPSAGALLARLCGLNGIRACESASVTVGGVEAVIMRTDFLNLPSYDLVVPSDAAEDVLGAVIGAGAGHGIARIGEEALDLLRIEQGVPAQGRELTEDANPLEAGLIDLISFNKGCYVGQEVVARLNTYDKVQRTLVGLSWDASLEPERAADLFADGRKVGLLTSAACPARTGRRIGLGLVRKAQARAGLALAVGSPDGPAAVVHDLPFGASPS